MSVGSVDDIWGSVGDLFAVMSGCKFGHIFQNAINASGFLILLIASFAKYFVAKHFL